MTKWLPFFVGILGMSMSVVHGFYPEYENATRHVMSGVIGFLTGLALYDALH